MFLTIENGKLVATDRTTTTTIADLAALKEFARKNPGEFYVSSSLAFPEEYTKDENVIKLAKIVVDSGE